MNFKNGDIVTTNTIYGHPIAHGALGRVSNYDNDNKWISVTFFELIFIAYYGFASSSWFCVEEELKLVNDLTSLERIIYGLPIE